MSDNLEIDKTIYISDAVTLDLNGFVLKMTAGDSVIRVGYLDGWNTVSGQLTLQDSLPTASHKFDKTNDLWVLDEIGGTETVTGGVITGGNGSYGGGVFIYNRNSSFTMNGGSIIGCKASDGGGGVDVNDGSFAMNDGRIAGCTTKIGGGVNNGGDSFTMTGGCIEDCTATRSGSALRNAWSSTMNANGGEIHGTVQNEGTIQNDADSVTVFRGDVKNEMSGVSTVVISGGIFMGKVENIRYIAYIGGSPQWPTITGGEFYGEFVVSYSGDIMPSGNITGGTFYGGFTGGDGTTFTSHIVTFNLNGGTDTGKYDARYMATGGRITKPANPERGGYTFDGWYEKDAAGAFKDTAFDFDTAITTDTTLHARFTPNTYTVTYSAGASGTGTILAGTKTHGVDFTLSSDTFARAGYTQTGWATTDGGGKVYDLGGSYTTDSNVTLYPVWETIWKLPPEIIDGKGQSLTEGEIRELTFRSNAAYSEFIRVELDGETVDQKNYTVKEGSTIVTLNAEYVATLSAGEHTLGIVSESGTATTAFTINAKAENNNTSPKTGDNSHMALWFELLFVSGSAVAGTAAYGKKKERFAK